MHKLLPSQITTTLFLLCFAINTMQASSSAYDQNALNKALFYACYNNNVGIAQSLLGLNAKVDTVYLSPDNPHVPWQRCSLFDVATYRNHDRIMSLLLEYGANPHAINPCIGLPPITIAAQRGNLKAIRLLLKEEIGLLWGRKVCPNSPDAFGGSPLIAAVEAGKSQAVEKLLSAKAQVDFAATGPDSLGTTALIQAVENDQIHVWHTIPSIVQQLLDARADVNKARTDGEAALHRAAAKGCYDAVDMLLKANADPNLPGENGRTPLHYAVSNNNNLDNNIYIIYLLRAAGGNRFIVDEKGKGPECYAINDVMKLALNQRPIYNIPKQPWFPKFAKNNIPKQPWFPKFSKNKRARLQRMKQPTRDNAPLLRTAQDDT